ncbi:MAG: hypothetical protein H6577_16030 [Lewinellaceae bacterium]|nr:hypothetical protein [Saprospiraceae bacterium]MCB9339637.1 hypothetical protein [Lewinellaceae bacterium]
MNQASTQTQSLHQDLSPEFLSWLDTEKSSAKNHQLRILKTVLVLILAACALFLFKGQPDWVQQIVQVAH